MMKTPKTIVMVSAKSGKVRKRKETKNQCSAPKITHFNVLLVSRLLHVQKYHILWRGLWLVSNVKFSRENPFYVCL